MGDLGPHKYEASAASPGGLGADLAQALGPETAGPLTDEQAEDPFSAPAVWLTHRSVPMIRRTWAEGPDR